MLKILEDEPEKVNVMSYVYEGFFIYLFFLYLYEHNNSPVVTLFTI